MNFNPQGTTFRVLIDEEAQYVIWPEHKAVPGAWTDIGVTGGKQDCLDYVELAWMDLCPLSFSFFMDQRSGPMTTH
ncbi:MAG TPA: MbtH family protein [Janthinobacterium sp.]|nr:MbtH family protein [Janthinobacterium sp.]